MFRACARYASAIFLAALIPAQADGRDRSGVDFSDPRQVLQMLEEEERRDEEVTAEFGRMVDARELSQAVAIADRCALAIDPDRLARTVQAITQEAGDPMGRMSFQTAGPAHKVRFERMSELERVIACAAARGAAARLGVLASD